MKFLAQIWLHTEEEGGKKQSGKRGRASELEYWTEVTGELPVVQGGGVECGRASWRNQRVKSHNKKT